MRGQIIGEDHALYDIWIVPGYIGPAHSAAEGWRQAGKDMKTYGQASLYSDTVDDAKKVLHFAHKDTFSSFVLKGTANAWQDGWHTAHDRVDRRVFGWWFAYPWALIEATGESALRIGLGVPGGVIIGGAGVTVVPVAELAWPATKGIYHSVVPGTVLPVAAVSWNTVIAPTMAVLGQQPNERRTDGFWVTRRPQVDEHQRALDAALESQRHASDLALEQWGESLLSAPDVRAEDELMQKKKEEYEQEMASISQKMQADQAAYQSRRQQLIRQRVQRDGVAPTIDKDVLLQQIQDRGRSSVLRGLQSDEKISSDDAEMILTLFLESVPEKSTEKPVDKNAEDAPSLQREPGEKTDPLKRSLELLREND